MIDRELLELPFVYRDGLFVFRVDSGSIRARLSFRSYCQCLLNPFMILYLRHLLCSQVLDLLAFFQLRVSQPAMMVGAQSSVRPKRQL